MAGLYIHIPFCKRRCKYCDFFSTTMLERREEYVAALVKEIAARKDEAGEPIRTVYIGGGTPSTLVPQDIARILGAIGIDQTEEVTMELNPGDATLAYMRALRNIGINRLCYGIQCSGVHRDLIEQAEIREEDPSDRHERHDNDGGLEHGERYTEDLLYLCGSVKAGCFIDGFVDTGDTGEIDNGLIAHVLPQVDEGQNERPEF